MKPKKKILIIPILIFGLQLFGANIIVSADEQPTHSASLWDIEDDYNSQFDSSHSIQKRSKGGYRATRIIECKKYGNCKSPIKQIWDNVQKMRKWLSLKKTADSDKSAVFFYLNKLITILNMSAKIFFKLCFFLILSTSFFI